MPLKYPLVHVDDVRPENMKQGEGWAISEFRLPISGKEGSSTTIFHSIFRPGSTHAKHLHRNCDEIAVTTPRRRLPEGPSAWIAPFSVTNTSLPPA